MATPSGASVTYAVEGTVDGAVARALLRQFDLLPGIEYVTRGKSNLDRRLTGFNAAARTSPWLVLRDLDEDAACPATLVARKLPQPAPLLCLRIAVREVEAWLLADRREIAAFLGVPVDRVSRDPEGLVDPKGHLVDLARRSRRREVREGMATRPGSGVKEGPLYVPMLSDFAENRWSPRRAAELSGGDSLARALRRLDRFARTGAWKDPAST